MGLSRAKQLFMAVVLGIPFTALTSLVMGSLLKGIGVLLLALLGLAVLGSVLRGLAWLFTLLLPMRWLPLANMARISLRRRGVNLVFAMIALFCGVVSIAMGVVVTDNATSTMREHDIDLQGYNLHVVAPYEQEAIQGFCALLGFGQPLSVDDISLRRIHFLFLIYTY
jgi:hypothetical protein